VTSSTEEQAAHNLSLGSHPFHLFTSYFTDAVGRNRRMFSIHCWTALLIVIGIRAENIFCFFGRNSISKRKSDCTSYCISGMSHQCNLIQQNAFHHPTEDAILRSMNGA